VVCVTGRTFAQKAEEQFEERLCLLERREMSGACERDPTLSQAACKSGDSSRRGGGADTNMVSTTSDRGASSFATGASPNPGRSIATTR